MIRTFKYRIYPTKKQAKILQATLDACRWLYNHFLEQRKTRYDNEKRTISRFEQNMSIPDLKQENPNFNNVYSQVLQDVAARIDKAFKAFFRRVKAGEKPGYPRFKGYFRYDSFIYPQSGWKVENDTIKLSKIGSIRIKYHRSIVGEPGTCTIKRSNDKWYVCISVEYEPEPLPETGEPVGIDLGIESFATLSTGETVENPKFFRTEEKELAKAQRKLSKLEKGTPERSKARKVVARVHERIRNKRHNFIHQLSRTIVDCFSIICMENLNIKGMVKNHCLAKSISDASWNMFAQVLAYKAAEAGRQVVQVDPRYTSQMCSQCGTVVKKDLSIRWHECLNCGLSLHRDHNASLNILRLGLQSLGKSVEALAL